jgi:DNA invertase Pin-like site-specific DNA recombinase
VFSEFERAMIQERVRAGLERARAKGVRIGRPPVPPVVKKKVAKLRQEGQSVRAIAKATGLSVGAVHRAISEAA